MSNMNTMEKSINVWYHDSETGEISYITLVGDKAKNFDEKEFVQYYGVEIISVDYE